MSDDDWMFMAWDKAIAPQYRHVEVIFGAYWVAHPDKGLLFYNPDHARTGRRMSLSWLFRAVVTKTLRMPSSRS